MTPQQQQRRARWIKTRDWVLTPAAAFSAAVFVSSWIDTRYVHASAFRTKTSIDSVAALEQRRADSVWKASLMTKVDSINLRVQQLTCGPRVQEGCR